MPTVVEKDQIASQVERILSSKEFSASRQLRDFLRFVIQRALEGTTHLDQCEIANAVLTRSANFNPLDDASVRKLATLTRQRLNHYYAEGGRADPILVSLPLRSYLPEFRERDISSSPPIPAVSPEPPLPSLSKRYRLALAGAGCILLVVSALALWRSLSQENTNHRPGDIVFQTVRGDIYGANLDLPGQAVRLGPPLGISDDVSVRMRFTPEMESHQAGLLLWIDADHYVKVGRRFTARSVMEFAVENDAQYQPAQRLLHYDPAGQTGEPVWLSLRRRGSLLGAYASRDGLFWNAVGEEIKVPFDLDKMRVGLYAFNGRRTAASIDAVFDHLGIGSTFGLGETGSGRWVTRCPEIASHDYLSPVLQTSFLAAQSSCSQTLMFPLPKGDWSYRTQIDFPATAGVSAGLLLHGEKGAIRLVRHFTSEPTVALIHEARDLSSVRDFAGSPRLVLRLSAKNGFVSASFSRDDHDFQTLSNQVKIEELGNNLEIGISHATGPWGVPQTVPSAEFYYFRRDVQQVENFR